MSHYCFLYVGEGELMIQQSVGFVSMLYLNLGKR
jgi:hypothetical protein